MKANKGAAGIDRETIQEFEKDLKGNLYKLWNRISSGSYFPPPVKGVEIPKKTGGKRMLGIPTVADRIAQTVVSMTLEPILEPVFHQNSYGYPSGQKCLRCHSRGERALLEVTGSWNSISENVSIRLIMVC